MCNGKGSWLKTSSDNLYLDICHSKRFLLTCVVCRRLPWARMDCDTSRRLLRIELDRHHCSDNGLGSEHNEANHFGPLSNAFHPSISLFCKILKMQMIKKKITIKSQHMARKNQALLRSNLRLQTPLYATDTEVSRLQFRRRSWHSLL